jgi:DNA repair protein RecN (Recombination protein N)
VITLLRIQNLVLVESATIPFRKGLNILSGETGAGKTAIMQALKLLGGAKSDPNLVRHGAEKAVIEAEFILPHDCLAWAPLTEGGFDPDPDEPLIIRREISLEGKGRIYINQKLASLPFLKSVGDYLFDIASQHASQKLTLESFQRETVDAFGNLTSLLQNFRQGWEEENQLETELEALKTSESLRLREIETLEREIEEISDARISPDEEEPLFKAYSDFATAEERSTLAEHALNLLEKSPLSELVRSLEKLSEIDADLKPIQELSKAAKIELDEVVWELTRYHEKISFSPEKMATMDERLKLINRLKKKYGATLSEVLEWKKRSEARLKTLSSSEERIDAITQKLIPLREENLIKAAALTEARIKAGHTFSQKMTEQLQALNMEKAIFSVRISPKPLSSAGCDLITFLFQPNAGGKELSVKEGASGGELARIFLSLKTLLQQKGGSDTLIFDEVDANIGGKTAKLLGEKLKNLGKHTQVIAITHFPQVAAFADHHLRVRKVEENGITRSHIDALPVEEREEELNRMVGAAV